MNARTRAAFACQPSTLFPPEIGVVAQAGLAVPPAVDDGVKGATGNVYASNSLVPGQVCLDIVDARSTGECCCRRWSGCSNEGIDLRVSQVPFAAYDVDNNDKNNNNSSNNAVTDGSVAGGDGRGFCWGDGGHSNVSDHQQHVVELEVNGKLGARLDGNSGEETSASPSFAAPNKIIRPRSPPNQTCSPHGCCCNSKSYGRDVGGKATGGADCGAGPTASGDGGGGIGGVVAFRVGEAQHPQLAQTTETKRQRRVSVEDHRLEDVGCGREDRAFCSGLAFGYDHTPSREGGHTGKPFSRVTTAFVATPPCSRVWSCEQQAPCQTMPVVADASSDCAIAWPAFQLPTAATSATQPPKTAKARTAAMLEPLTGASQRSSIAGEEGNIARAVGSCASTGSDVQDHDRGAWNAEKKRDSGDGVSTFSCCGSGNTCGSSFSPASYRPASALGRFRIIEGDVSSDCLDECFMRELVSPATRPRQGSIGTEGWSSGGYPVTLDGTC